MAKFEPVTEAELDSISQTDDQLAIRAVSAAYDARLNGVTIQLGNGVAATFPLSMLPGLEAASPEDLEGMVIEGAGYGLHVPALDADLSIPRLFETYLGATAMARAQRRTTASRANGRLGGRPRKTKAA